MNKWVGESQDSNNQAIGKKKPTNQPQAGTAESNCDANAVHDMQTAIANLQGSNKNTADGGQVCSETSPHRLMSHLVTGTP